ncbi:MAG: hypothetical protein JWO38_4151 [Gemmataceae bacterium]|nr:hypothetical protein [Gemmataceae bacterium]
MSVRVRTITVIVLTALVARGAAQPPTPGAGRGTTPPPGKPEIGPTFPADEKVFKLLAAGQARPIPADATPLRKICLAQIREGGEFLSWTQGRLQIDYFMSSDYPPVFEVIDRTYLLLAESESGAAGKIAALEERVAAFKRFERVADTRCTVGRDPPHERNRARFWLLGAEGDLLTLKEQHAEAAPPTPPREAGRGAVPRPDGTESEPAIPADVKRHKLLAAKLADEKVYQILAAKLAAPIPADATPHRKACLAQLREGKALLQAARERLTSDRCPFWDSDPVLDQVDRMYRLLADLEPGPAGKVAILHERVAVLTQYERLTTALVDDGIEPPPRKNFVRLRRLGAEADMLRLKEQPAQTGKR